MTDREEIDLLWTAIIRWVRADRAWTLCQGRDPAVQDEMDQATYRLHVLADAREMPPKRCALADALDKEE